MTSPAHSVALNAAEAVDRLDEMVEQDPSIEILGSVIVIAFRGEHGTEVATWSDVTPLSGVRMLTRAIALEGSQLT